MGLCSIHGRPNNRYGYCVGCEMDPSIVIHSCSSCGKPFANNIENSAKECPSCIAGFVTRSYNASATTPKTRKSLDEYSREDYLGLMDILSPLLITIVGLIVASKSTSTNGYLIFAILLGPGIVAAIAARSVGLFFRYFGIGLLIAIGVSILGDIFKWPVRNTEVILLILLGCFATWRAFKQESLSKEKYEVIPTKFPYVLSGAAVLSLFVLITSFAGRGEDAVAIKIRNYSFAIVNVASANLRSGSSTSNSIVGKVHRGDTLRVISTSNDWLFIEYKNKKGYVYKKLVTQNTISVSE